MGLLKDFRREKIKLAAQKLQDNVTSIETFISAGIITLDEKQNIFHLSPFCFSGRNTRFKENYIHALSQYLIFQKKGLNLPFTVREQTSDTFIASYHPKTGISFKESA